MRRPGEHVFRNTALHLREDAGAHLRDEREALVLAADPWHAAVQEHEREVLRLLFAELVQPPRGGAHIVERVVARRTGELPGAELSEAFLGEGEEDLILRREVAVDGAGAVFDLGGDVSNGDLRVPVCDEEFERGVQNGAARAFARELLAFFSARVPCLLLD